MAASAGREAADVSASGGGKKSLKPIPRKQAFLETFFYSIGQFAFDRARDLVEKEKENFPPLAGSSWCSFLSVLDSLAQVEKSYFSLQYVARKFIRRDFIRPLYANLLHELKKFEDWKTPVTDGSQTPDRIDTLVKELARQLGNFVQARHEMVDFYEFMTKSGWGLHNIDNRIDLIALVDEVAKKHHKGFHHPVLDPLQSSYSLEVDVVQHLFQAEDDMSRWKFSSSLMLLYECQAKLACWKEVFPSVSAKEQLLASVSLVSSFGGGPSKQGEPPLLYHWLSLLHAALISKFSLYFYTTLRSQTTGNEMKALFSKAPIDYFSKLSSFHKKADAYNISIILDINTAGVPFKGHGYHLPNVTFENPTGIDSYPAILSWPEDSPVKDFWPDVISVLAFAKSDQPIYFFDEKTVRSYFMVRVDTAMTLAVIFTCKKKEKDSVVQNFLHDMKSSLTHEKLYQMLKPGQAHKFI